MSIAIDGISGGMNVQFKSVTEEINARAKADAKTTDANQAASQATLQGQKDTVSLSSVNEHAKTQGATPMSDQEAMELTQMLTGMLKGNSGAAGSAEPFNLQNIMNSLQ
ncbi:MAG TPA: hypothetical protein PKK26_14740 [Candidatus Wallbacteria bacterium]|nr:hypothetical protein [Candidatus Wallbacteria bacterium]